MDIFVTLIMVFCIIIASLLLIPNIRWLRRILGYMFAADVSISAYVVSTYAATGTVSGLAIAIMAAVGISLTLRGIRFFSGCERYTVNGSDNVRTIAKAVMMQGKAWFVYNTKSVFFKDTEKPETLNGEWVKHEPVAVTWMKAGAEYLTSLFETKFYAT